MKKVLIVDDINEYALVMEMYLPHGYEAISASTIDEAKEMFAKEQISLSIIDIRLNAEDKSDISGLELLSWVKENHPETNVIMISAYHGSEYAIESIGRGAYAFLDKPIQPMILKELLGELL